MKFFDRILNKREPPANFYWLPQGECNDCDRFHNTAAKAIKKLPDNMARALAQTKVIVEMNSARGRKELYSEHCDGCLKNHPAPATSSAVQTQPA